MKRYEDYNMITDVEYTLKCEKCGAFTIRPDTEKRVSLFNTKSFLVCPVCGHKELINV